VCVCVCVWVCVCVCGCECVRVLKCVQRPLTRGQPSVVCVCVCVCVWERERERERERSTAFSAFNTHGVTHLNGKKSTGWRRLIGCFRSPVISRKRATKYRALLRKIIYKDKSSYDYTPPCTAFSHLNVRVMSHLNAHRVPFFPRHAHRILCHCFVEFVIHIQHDSHTEPCTSGHWISLIPFFLHNANRILCHCFVERIIHIQHIQQILHLGALNLPDGHYLIESCRTCECTRRTASFTSCTQDSVWGTVLLSHGTHVSAHCISLSHVVNAKAPGERLAS